MQTQDCQSYRKTKAGLLQTSWRTTEQPSRHPRKATGPYAGHDPDYSGMVVSRQKGLWAAKPTGGAQSPIALSLSHDSMFQPFPTYFPLLKEENDPCEPYVTRPLHC